MNCFFDGFCEIIALMTDKRLFLVVKSLPSQESEEKLHLDVMHYCETLNISNTWALSLWVIFYVLKISKSTETILPIETASFSLGIGLRLTSINIHFFQGSFYALIFSILFYDFSSISSYFRSLLAFFFYFLALIDL